MKKTNEYTRRTISVEEVGEVFRTSDNILYTVYKDEDGNYYTDAYDAASSVVQFNAKIESDSDAIAYAQRYIDEIDEQANEL